MIAKTALKPLLVLVILTPSSPAQEATSPFVVALAGGYALFSPSDVNSFMSRIARPEINGGFTVSGNIGCFVTQTLSLHIAGGYLSGASKSEIPLTSSAGPTVIGTVEDEYRITAVPIGAGAIYHVSIEPITLNIGAFADLNFVTVEYRLEGTAANPIYSEKRTNSTFGAHASAGPEFRIVGGLTFEIELGYRVAKPTGMNGDQGFLPASLDVDFSGFYGEGGVRYRF